MSPWTPLADGEPVGVVGLSGPVRVGELERGLDVLRGWGHPLHLAPNLRSRSGYLCGDDDERLAGLEWVLDQGVRVVFAARGGYGATRLLSSLPWQRLEAERVCLVGFSDLTAVMNALVSNHGAAQVHGPMVAAGLHRQPNAARVQAILYGRREGQALFRFGERAVVRGARAEGIAMGGNLAVLTALLGTEFGPQLDDSVLFLEDVGEPMYRIDRMLTHLACSGKLDRVKALIGGGLQGCTPVSTRSRTWSRLLAEVAPEGAAVVTGLPFGHGARNMAFPLGVMVDVNTRCGLIRWSR